MIFLKVTLDSFPFECWSGGKCSYEDNVCHSKFYTKKINKTINIWINITDNRIHIIG